MNKELPSRVKAESNKNPDPMLFVEFEGDEGPEYIPFTILGAEAANRQADAMEAALPLLERIAVALEKSNERNDKKDDELVRILGAFPSDIAQVLNDIDNPSSAEEIERG